MTSLQPRASSLFCVVLVCNRPYQCSAGMSARSSSLWVHLHRCRAVQLLWDVGVLKHGNGTSENCWSLDPTPNPSPASPLCLLMPWSTLHGLSRWFLSNALFFFFSWSFWFLIEPEVSPQNTDIISDPLAAFPASISASQSQAKHGCFSTVNGLQSFII